MNVWLISLEYRYMPHLLAGWEEVPEPRGKAHRIRDEGWDGWEEGREGAYGCRKAKRAELEQIGYHNLKAMHIRKLIVC